VACLLNLNQMSVPFVLLTCVGADCLCYLCRVISVLELTVCATCAVWLVCGQSSEVSVLCNLRWSYLLLPAVACHLNLKPNVCAMCVALLVLELTVCAICVVSCVFGPIVCAICVVCEPTGCAICAVLFVCDHSSASSVLCL